MKRIASLLVVAAVLLGSCSDAGPPQPAAATSPRSLAVAETISPTATSTIAGTEMVPIATPAPSITSPTPVITATAIPSTPGTPTGSPIAAPPVTPTGAPANSQQTPQYTLLLLRLSASIYYQRYLGLVPSSTATATADVAEQYEELGRSAEAAAVLFQAKFKTDTVCGGFRDALTTFTRAVALASFEMGTSIRTNGPWPDRFLASLPSLSQLEARMNAYADQCEATLPQ